MKRQEQGVGKLTITVFALLIAAVGFVVYKVGPFYYSYFELINQMQSAIRVASTEDDLEIRKRLLAHIRKLEIPVEPEELIIEREDTLMKIALPYEEVFYITWKGKDYDIYTFKFRAYAEGRFERKH